VISIAESLDRRNIEFLGACDIWKLSYNELTIFGKNQHIHVLGQLEEPPEVPEESGREEYLHRSLRLAMQ
jgi:hypothetical protein